MTEPTITCPNCKTEIRLTESLAAPLIAATRQQFERHVVGGFLEPSRLFHKDPTFSQKGDNLTVNAINVRADFFNGSAIDCVTQNVLLL